MNIICNPVLFLLVSNCYFNLRPNFWLHCFNSPESKAEVRYVNEYIDGLLLLSVHIFKKYISRVEIKFHEKHICSVLPRPRPCAIGA